jgi:hypothetical protein
MIRKAVLLTAALCLAVGIGTAHAIPTLQIYIEGATYDSNTDTWVLTNGGNFRLWVIGDVGSYGTIEDVMISCAVATSEVGTGTLALVGSTADGDGNYNGVDDPSTASNPTLMIDPNVTANDGDQPIDGNGDPLPTHGIYGAGTSFYQFSLGDFTLTDSQIGDFNGADPFPLTFPSSGQINVYDVTVTGFTSVHFDAFDHFQQNDQHVKYVFAPFSHDGETGGGGGGGGDTPEPGTIALFGMGLAGLAIARRK